jgi:hypothetical protein
VCEIIVLPGVRRGAEPLPAATDCSPALTDTAELARLSTAVTKTFRKYADDDERLIIELAGHWREIQSTSSENNDVDNALSDLATHAECEILSTPGKTWGIVAIKLFIARAVDVGVDAVPRRDPYVRGEMDTREWAIVSALEDAARLLERGEA